MSGVTGGSAGPQCPLQSSSNAHIVPDLATLRRCSWAPDSNVVLADLQEKLGACVSARLC